MKDSDAMLREHCDLTRRYFFQLGGAATVAWAASPVAASDPQSPELRAAIEKLEYLTPVDRGYVLDKGKAEVAKLAPAELRESGLTPETWTLEIVPDPVSNSVVEQPLARALGNAFSWSDLMRLTPKHSVSFLHVCVCTNGNDPFHMTLWEGVPLREVIWMARPKANIRRVYYQSYHRPDFPPFQSSLPLSRILETPPGEAPVVLAFKMNGQPIPAAHGGPVRVVVPGAYGNKSIKWVRRVVLTNDYRANDSDAELNNDVESPLKTRARFINAPNRTEPDQPFALTGFAQVGISGLSRVQYCVRRQSQSAPAPEPLESAADWQDAAILSPPAHWGGGLAGSALPANTTGIDPKTGRPAEWPLRYTIVHWSALVPGLRPGIYDLSCRTIDLNGIAQPLPRPLLRTGVTAIEHVTLTVETGG